MKNLVVICLVLSAFIFAQDCEVKKENPMEFSYPATEINLLDNYTLDLSKMPDVLPKVENFSTNDTAYWAYQATSDSSVLVFVLTDAIKFFKMCSSKEECNSLIRTHFIENIVIEEFLRLQSAGVFKGSATEADSLIRHIVAVIKEVRQEGLSNMSYNLYHANQDEASLITNNGMFCENYGGHYGGDLCGLIDTVRQCKIHLQEPMSLGNPLRQNNTLEFRNQVFRNRDASGKFLNKSTARKAKY